MIKIFIFTLLIISLVANKADAQERAVRITIEHDKDIHGIRESKSQVSIVLDNCVQRYPSRGFEQLTPQKVDGQIAECAKKIKNLLEQDGKQMPEKSYRAGNTSLHMAASRGYYNIVKILLEDPRYNKIKNLKNDVGLTPLDLASAKMSLYYPNISAVVASNKMSLVFSMLSNSVIEEYAFISKLKPYEKTVHILKQHNALSTCALYSCLEKTINSEMKQLDDMLLDNKGRNKMSPKMIKDINNVKDKLSKKLTVLKSFKNNVVRNRNIQNELHSINNIENITQAKTSPSLITEKVISHILLKQLQGLAFKDIEYEQIRSCYL